MELFFFFNEIDRKTLELNMCIYCLVSIFLENPDLNPSSPIDTTFTIITTLAINIPNYCFNSLILCYIFIDYKKCHLG